MNILTGGSRPHKNHQSLTKVLPESHSTLTPLSLQSCLFFSTASADPDSRFNYNAGYEFRRLMEPVPTGIYECNKFCKCKDTCLNKVAQKPLRIPLQVISRNFFCCLLFWSAVCLQFFSGLQNRKKGLGHSYTLWYSSRRIYLHLCGQPLH